jgi:hypothetical protein
MAWFDSNRNGRRDAGEPALPGMLVTVKADGANVVTRGRVRVSPSAIVAVVRTALTDQQGHYSFEVLGAGRYEVELAAPTGSAVDPSWTGSTGSLRAPVDVAPLQVARVDFAAAGSGSTVGVVVTPGGNPVPLAEVTCAWPGLDQQFGTADDVQFSTASGGDGSFAFDAVPVGSLNCSALDPGTGHTSPIVSAVASPETDSSARVVIQLGGSAAAGGSPSLPATGDSILPLLRAGLLLVVIGSLAVVIARRRPTTVHL